MNGPSKFALSLLVAAGITGCAVGPNYHEPKANAARFIWEKSIPARRFKHGRRTRPDPMVDDIQRPGTEFPSSSDRLTAI